MHLQDPLLRVIGADAANLGVSEAAFAFGGIESGRQVEVRARVVPQVRRALH